jgi:hypothetical protein
MGRARVAAVRTVIHLVAIASVLPASSHRNTCRTSVHGKPRTYGYAMYGVSAVMATSLHALKITQ